MAHRSPTVVLVDDDDSDRALIARAASACGEAVRVVSLKSGEELLRYLDADGPYADRRSWPEPDLILLDMYMPGLNGWEVLEALNEMPRTGRVPVIALTNAGRDVDVSLAYDLGASAYITKPLDFHILTQRMCVLAEFWFNTAQLPTRRQPRAGVV